MYFSVKTQCFIAIVRRFIPLMETHKLNQSYKAEIPSQNKQSRLLASTFKVSPLWACTGRPIGRRPNVQSNQWRENRSVSFDSEKLESGIAY